MATQTIYDHPLYYDVLFGFDRSREAEFFHRTFLAAGAAAGERVLEVAAGPARVGRLLARRGWSVTALDRSPEMLALAREAAAAEGTRIETRCGDMRAFESEAEFAAACNPLSSFRLLHSDPEADAHLRCMAKALRPGGVYALDLAFVAKEGDPVRTTGDSWEMTRGEVTVEADDSGVRVTDSGVPLRLAWSAGAHLRGYTAQAFAERVRACPGLEIEGWYRELSRDTGVSEFSDVASRELPVGRAMVVLRRR
jgi:SAM-dependent methyltransferase